MAFTFTDALVESLPTGIIVALGYAGTQNFFSLSPVQTVFWIGSLTTVTTAVGMYLGRN